VARTLSDWAKSYGEIELFIDRDLLEFGDQRERDEFMLERAHLEKVGERFALANRLIWSESLIDYARPPSRCISLRDTYWIQINREQADLGIDQEIQGFAEKDSNRDLYKVSRESVVKSGLKAEQILNTLRSRSKKLIDEKLVVAIRGWCGEIRSLSLEELMLLRIEDESVVTGILDEREIRECIAGQLGFGLFVIKKDRVQELRNALGKVGIEPRMSMPLDKPSGRRFAALMEDVSVDFVTEWFDRDLDADDVTADESAVD
jgi:hypothetical protein